MSLCLMSSVVQAASALNACNNPGSAVWIVIMASGGCTGIYAFSIALGIISTVLIAAYLLAFTFFRDRLPDRSLLYLAGFLFLWWIIGVASTTFQMNVIPNTAYFSTWSSFIFSGLILHSEWEQFQVAAARIAQLEQATRATFYCVLASIVNFASAVTFCVQQNCPPLNIYALVVGPISLVVCLIFLRVEPERFGGADKPLSVFLVLWWSIAVGVQCVGGPFIIAGNGLFSCFAAFVLSFFVAQSRIFPVSNNALNEV